MLTVYHIFGIANILFAILMGAVVWYDNTKNSSRYREFTIAVLGIGLLEFVYLLFLSEMESSAAGYSYALFVVFTQTIWCLVLSYSAYYISNLKRKNVQLYNESEKQRNLVETALAKIGAILSSQLDLRDTLDDIADMVVDMLKSNQSIIAMTTTNTNELQIVATCGINTPPTILPLKQSLSAIAVSENKAVYISDLYLRPEIFRPQLIFSNIRSIIAAPLVNDGNIIGVIEVYSNVPNAFNDHDAAFLTAIAHHAGAAIASAMLYEETKLKLAEEKFLSEIAQSTALTIDTKTIIEECTALAVKALEGSVGLGFLAAEENDCFDMITAINFSGKLTPLDLGSFPRLKQWLHAEKPFTTTADDFPMINRGLANDITINHIMALPLAVNHRLLGLILVGWHGFVTPARLKRHSFAKIMAQQIALGLEKAQLYNQIKSMALSDGLTNLANRRNFDMFLKTELRRAQSLKRPLSLIMVDLDKFKHYNDAFGHLRGDQLLTQIGKILRDNVRTIDLPARYGGEEFSIILPEGSLNEALEIAENLRKVIEESNFPDQTGQNNAKITASFGIATYDPNLTANAPTAETIISIADKSLYQAKQQGRNRIIGASIFQ